MCVLYTIPITLVYLREGDWLCKQHIPSWDYGMHRWLENGRQKKKTVLGLEILFQVIYQRISRQIL